MRARIVSISIVLLVLACGGGSSSDNGGSTGNNQHQGTTLVWRSIPKTVSGSSVLGNEIAKSENGVYGVAYTVFDAQHTQGRVFAELVGQDLSIFSGWPREIDSAGYCFFAENSSRQSRLCRDYLFRDR